MGKNVLLLRSCLGAARRAPHCSYRSPSRAGASARRGNAGAVYIWFGVPTASQTADDADVSVYGDNSYDYLGYLGTVTAADYDGDGVNDIMTAAYAADTNGTSSGTVYVNYGPFTSGTSIVAGDSDVMVSGSASYDYLGYGSASGDLNDDGYDDLALGAYGNDSGGSGAGQAYVFFGSASGWSGSAMTSPDVTVTGGTSSDYMGRSLTLADFNGDSNTDLMVGAGGNDDNGSTAGKVYIFSGHMLLVRSRLRCFCNSERTASRCASGRMSMKSTITMPPRFRRRSWRAKA